MEKNKGKIRVVFFVAVIVMSALLGVGAAALALSPSEKRMFTIVWLGVVFVASLAINLLWYREFNQKIAALRPILMEEHDADRYISEMNALLEGKKSPQIRAVLCLNLSAAYCEKKEYNTAKDLLLQLNPRKLAGINPSIYWADLAYVHFYLQEHEQASSILMQQKVPFSKLRDHPLLGGLIAILFIFQALAEGDKAGARQLLEQARPQWENEHTAPDFDYLNQLC